LLEAAGETSLTATAGALAGMAAGALLMTSLLVGTLVPMTALLDRLENRYCLRRRGLVLRPESSTLLGALMGLFCGVSVGTPLGALAGAASLLDLIEGRPFSFAFVQVGTRLGIFVGGITGAAAAVRAVYRQVPEGWRDEVRRGFRTARPA